MSPTAKELGAQEGDILVLSKKGRRFFGKPRWGGFRVDKVGEDYLHATLLNRRMKPFPIGGTTLGVDEDLYSRRIPKKPSA